MAKDTTDGKKPKPTPKFKRVPEGERVLVELKIRDNDGDASDNNQKVISRMKEGTAQFLKLEAVKELPRGKGKSYLRGSKGTKSFVLKLKKTVTVGGANVSRLSVPVPGTVTVSEFYAFAKGLRNSNIVGIITPNGKSYGFTIDTSDDK